MQLKYKELLSAATLQYQVSRHLECKQWINEFRQNCRCDLSDDWIDKKHPSLDDRNLQTSKYRHQCMLPNHRATYVLGPFRI